MAVATVAYTPKACAATVAPEAALTVVDLGWIKRISLREDTPSDQWEHQVGWSVTSGFDGYQIVSLGGHRAFGSGASPIWVQYQDYEGVCVAFGLQQRLPPPGHHFEFTLVAPPDGGLKDAPGDAPGEGCARR